MRIANTKEQGVILYATCLTVAGLILLRDFGFFTLNNYYLIVASVVPMFFLNYSNFLCLNCFLFPLTFGIPSNYIFLISIGLLFFKKKNLDLTSVVMFAVFGFWTLFLQLMNGSPSTLGPNFSNATVIGYLTRLLLFFVLINERSLEVDYDRALALFSLGFIIMVIAVVAYFVRFNPFSDIFDYGVRIGDSAQYFDNTDAQGMRMNTNTNNIACYCLCAMGCCLNLFIKHRKIAWAALFFLITLLGTLTVSRAYIAMAVIMMFLFIYLSGKGHTPFYLKLVYLAIVVFAIYYFLQSDIAGLFEHRFESGSLAEDSRTRIFKGYMDGLLDNPGYLLVGAGVFTHRYLLFPGQACHNMLQQILISYGVFGFLIFVIYVLKVVIARVKTIKGCKYIRIAALSTLGVVFLYQQTIQFLLPYDLLFPFIIGMFGINNFRYSN